MSRRRFCVYASEMASLIGVNPFRQRSDALRNVMVRQGILVSEPSESVCVEKAAEAVLQAMPEIMCEARSVSTGREAAATLTPSIPAIAAIASKPVEPIHAPSRKLSTGKTPSIETPSTETTPAEKDVFSGVCLHAVRKAVEGKLVCEVGKAREAVDMKMHGASPFHRQKALSKNMVTDEGLSYVLWGRADAVTDVTVDEYKNRKNRLFGQVPPYELPQIYAYMFLSGKRKARQIETHGQEQLVHEIEFRDAVWNWYKSELDKAVEEMEEMRKTMIGET